MGQYAPLNQRRMMDPPNIAPVIAMPPGGNLQPQTAILFVVCHRFAGLSIVVY